MTCLAHARGARDNYVRFALRHEFEGVDRWDMTISEDLSQSEMWRSKTRFHHCANDHQYPCW